MLKEKVNDIEIWYDESIDIRKAKLMISNNYSLFLKQLEGDFIISLVPTNEDVLYIPDLDLFLNNTFMYIYNNEKIRSAYQSLCLENAYLLFLTRNFFDGNTRLINVNNAVSDESFNEVFGIVVPFLYFHEEGNVDSYIEYMKYRNQDMSLKIYTWLKEKCRYDTYNMVQEIIVNKIKNDKYFYDNFGNILNVMYNEMKHNYVTNLKLDNLPKISKEKNNELVIRFFKMINAPEEWISKYIDLIKNNRLVYEKSEGITDALQCFKDGNELKILIKSTGTIKDFLAVIHEFMHYLSWNDNYDLSEISIMEFPSIFFEKLASFFLMKCGYDKKIVQYAEDFRNLHNVSTAMDLYPIFSSIYEYMENGPINRDNEIKKIEEALEKHKSVIGETITIKDLYAKMGINLPDVSIEEFVDQKYDKLTKDIIGNDILILDGFQYIIATYLSRILLKNIDRDIIDKMIMVTNELSSLDLENVLKLLDLEDVLEEKGKVKIKEY